MVIALRTPLMWLVLFDFTIYSLFGLLSVIDFLLLQFKMREPQMCNVVCRLTLDSKTANEFKEKIEDEYRVNMYVYVLQWTKTNFSNIVRDTLK